MYLAVVKVQLHFIFQLARERRASIRNRQTNCDTDIMSLFIENFYNEYQDYQILWLWIKLDGILATAWKALIMSNTSSCLYIVPNWIQQNTCRQRLALSSSNITFNSMAEVVSALIECFEYLEKNKEMVSKLTYFK